MSWLEEECVNIYIHTHIYTVYVCVYIRIYMTPILMIPSCDFDFQSNTSHITDSQPLSLENDMVPVMEGTSNGQYFSVTCVRAECEHLTIHLFFFPFF